MSKQSVLAVMDSLIADRAAWLPDGGRDLAGSTAPSAIANTAVRAGVEAIHSNARTRHADAVEARATVERLAEKADAVATVLSNLIAARQVDARYGDHVTDLTAALAAFRGES